MPRRERVRRSSLLALADPISLHIAPDAARSAQGSLFLDDGVSTPRAAGSAASLVQFAFGCHAQDGADSAGMVTCELRATPTLLWGAAAECRSGGRDASCPHLRVEMESVLLRGVHLRRGGAADGATASTAAAAATIGLASSSPSSSSSSVRVELWLLETLAGERADDEEGQRGVAAVAEQTARGLLVRGVAAPLQRAWVLRVRLPAGSLLV